MWFRHWDVLLRGTGTCCWRRGSSEGSELGDRRCLVPCISQSLRRRNCAGGSWECFRSTSSSEFCWLIFRTTLLPVLGSETQSGVGNWASPRSPRLFFLFCCLEFRPVRAGL